MSSRPAKRRLVDTESASPASAPASAPARKARSAAVASSLPVATPPPTPTPAVVVEEEDKPKIIMSRAQRRKLKHPPVVVTAEMKERAREEKRELRKYLRMIKSNGSRRKIAKLREKRQREDNANEEAFNPLFQATKKGRRLE